MPIELDSLLFWCGLGLLCVGLFVFLTGKKASADSKKESNRFEAFGIKIDVNNPSLILIMLGVVMMLAPKFMPQEVKQATQSEKAESKTVIAAVPEPSPSQPSQIETTPEITAPAPLTPMTEEVIGDKQNTTSSSPTAVIPPVPQAAQPSVPKSASATPTPSRPSKSSSASPPIKTSSAKPAPSPPKPSPAPVPAPIPAPLKQAKSEQAPEIPQAAPPLLVVAVAADADERAGITTSAQVFAQQTAGLIVEKAGQVFNGRYEIVSRQAGGLRESLDQKTQAYAPLCSQFRAQVLVLGDLRISKAWSTIDSAYWPDYHIHLHHCDKGRSRQEVFKHLNPSNRDNFPFEQSIENNTMKFLSDSRWVVEG